MLITIKGVEYNLNNPYDFESVCSRYSNIEHMIFGETSNNEMITISIGNDSVITKVYQDNGWVRKTIYMIDCVEETYEWE